MTKNTKTAAKMINCKSLNKDDKAAANKLRWSEYAEKHLLGRTIVGIRYLTDKEVEDMGWYQSSVVFILDNGSLFFPSADDEGNDAGALFGQTEKGEEITMPVI